MTEQVRLRPAEEVDLPVLQRLTQDPHATGEFEWRGWYDPKLWRRRWEENGLIGQDGGTLMIVTGPDRLGLVNWRRRQIGPAAYCWEIGIALAPEARGHGYGTQAQRLLVRYLFAHTPVQRIEASTDVQNIAEQRALEKTGFSREGVSRSIGWRNGEWRDGVTYSILRTDPAAASLRNDPALDMSRADQTG